MNILYDHQVFSLEVVGGMSKYYSELIEGLIRLGHQVRLPLRRTHNYQLQKLKDLHIQIASSASSFFRLSFKGKQNLVYRYNKYRFLMNPGRYLQGVDLVHMTLFDPYMIDTLRTRSIPFIYNVYDLNHKTQLLKKGWFDRKMCDYADEGIQLLGDSARAIICVSEQTKKDLLTYYPTLDPSKIEVIYHSIDLESIYAEKSQYGNNPIEGNYILYIGKRQADYKNFKPFVQAVAPLLSSDLKLVCLGHMTLDTEEIELLESLHIENYVVQVGGNELFKYQLLSHAVCFAYPSLAEGFGIPILEAWAVGCPVLCSNIPVFMEIGQNAVLYFDPRSIENMRELIAGVIKNQAIQDNLRKAGYERVKLFDKSVEIGKTMELYERVISQNLQIS